MTTLWHAIALLVLLTTSIEVDAQEIYEPGIIVVEPSFLPDALGRKLSLSCVGYGAPYLPEIVWKANGPNGIINFNNPETDLDFDINIHTMIITDDTGLNFVLSILELCNVNYMFYNMYDEFQCHAISPNVTGVSTIGRNYSEPVSVIPFVYEPATLLAAPTEGEFVTHGPRLSATCVAYGSPQPDMYWTINDEPVEEGNYTNIYNSIITDANNDILLISTLEICNTMFQPIMGNVSCTARNGVSVGADTRVQSVQFMVQPKLEISAYTVQVRSDTAEFIFTVSAPVTIEENDSCFMNKLKLRNGSDVTSASFTPRYPGTCNTSRDSTTVRASLDPRDYSSALQFFLSLNTNYIQSIPSLEQEFVPGYDLLPIEEPIGAEVFIRNSERLYLSSFDVNLRLNQVILHFTGFVDANTLITSLFTLRSVRTSNSVNLASSSLRVQSNYARSICISLTTDILIEMMNKSICTTSAIDCASSFPSNLVHSIDGSTVAAVDANGATFNVFKLILLPEGPVPDLYMEVFLQYSGCDTSYILSKDEVYSLRNGEVLTRLECVATGLDRNTNPIISYDQQIDSQNMSAIAPESVSRNWPRRTAINIPNGTSDINYGLYSCNTLENEAQHYIVEYDAEEAGRLYFPNGNNFQVQLYNSFSVPFVLGGVYPSVSLLDDTVRILYEFDAQIRRISYYRGELYFSRVRFSQAGNYNFSVSIMLPSNSTIQSSRGYFLIAVTVPDVAVVPLTLVLAPDTERVNLQCIPSNPYLPVIWTSSASLGNIRNSELELPLVIPQGGYMDGTEITCNVLDPEILDGQRIVANFSAIVRNIPRKLVIFRGSIVLDAYQQVVKSDELNFQCLIQSSNANISIYWIIEEDMETAVIVREDVEDESFSASFGYNYANLVIRNEFVGTITCLSSDLGTKQTIIVVNSLSGKPSSCSGNSVDNNIFNILWEKTPAGFRDAQPCNLINDRGVEGFAFRQCQEDSTWENFVNISDCQTTRIKDLRENAEDLFSSAGRITNDSLSSSLSELTADLVSSTAPGQGSLFPRDLETTNYLIRNILYHLPRDNVQIGLIDVFNNTLDSEYEMGWIELNKLTMGSNQLLSNIEDFSSYLTAAQREETLTLKRTNIIVSSRKFSGGLHKDILFPENSDLASKDGQVLIPESLLQEASATGTANSLIRNFETLLPPEESITGNDGKTAVVGTVLISVQVLTDSGRKLSFGDEVIQLGYTTKPLPGAESPVCVFWNETSNQWDSVNGIETKKVSRLDSGKNKTYQVNCSANHATAFAVLTTPEDEEFNFTIPVYVGCGAILLSAAISIFCLFFSCITDSKRNYSAVAFLTHMSFCSSLICAIVAFWAGIELALVDERACIATAAALHFFFTAAFSWLLCEALVLIFYPWFSRYCWSFIIIFVIGWFLPAVPTAISLGLLRDDYTTSTHCWFFFDGTVQNNIVLAFMVPKVAIILVTLLLLLVGCMTTCYRGLSYPEGSPSAIIHLLRITWCGIFVLLLFLSATWVFVLLLVNVYGIDSVISGWVFMAASLGLAICMFILFLVITILNQRVVYDSEEGTTRKDAKRATKYEMTTTLITETVVMVENPIATDENADDDDCVDMRGNVDFSKSEDDYVEMRSQVDHGLEEQKEGLLS